MERVYDAVVAEVSEVILDALRKQGELDEVCALGLDASVRDVLRLVGHRTMTLGLTELATAAVAEAREAGFTINRSAVIEVSTLFDVVSVPSPYLNHSGTKKKARPVRDELGLRHRCKTPAVERALTDFGIEDSFQLAAERFEEHYGWAVGRTSVLRVVEAQADAAMAYVEERLDKEPDIEGRGPDLLLLELDGCELRTAELGEPHPTERTPVRGLPRRKRPSQWRDVRLAFSRPLGTDDKLFVGGLKPYDEVVDQLYQVATHQGMDRHTVVTAVVDGGNGLKEAIEHRFGDVVCFLDRPHLEAHLHDTAKAMDLGDAERHAWVAETIGTLSDGQVASVLTALREYDGPGVERVKQLTKHLTRFEDAVAYGMAHAWGVPQGSGEIESAHRYIPQRRLKLPGASWRPDHINPMLALRLVRANGWWQDFWHQQAPQRRAA